MDTRLIAIGLAGLLGLVVGGALWAVSGGSAQGQALDALNARLTEIPNRSRARVVRPGDALAQALALPLFAPSAPLQVGAEVAVQLFGIARSPYRTAALLSIGGAPAEWLSVGEARGGATLKAVSGSSVTISAPLGDNEVMLGVSAPAPGVPLPASGPPPGFKSPPPPASAPDMPQ